MSNSTEMFIQILGKESIGIEVEGNYNRYEDDPAYDAGSGNSLTCSYMPDITYELESINIDLREVKNTLEDLGDKDVEITISYEYSQCKSHDVTSTIVPASNLKLIEGFIYDHAFDIVNDMVEYNGDQ